MVMDDVQEDDIFNRANLKRALRFEHLKTFQPAGGVGVIATFSVTIPGLMKIKWCSLQRACGEGTKLVVGRTDRSGGFAVEMRGWLRGAIYDEAIKAVRERVKKDLAALEAVDETETDPPMHVPGLDVSALPEQLMRAPRKAKSSWL
jgi:hypothetical protein